MTSCTPYILKALADDTRFAIVSFLAEKTTASCGEISERFPLLSQPTMSHHFKVLTDADIVCVTKESTRRLYTLNTKRLQESGIDTSKWL
jgi:DNA-binding transcriptional ArsR family regulator